MPIYDVPGVYIEEQTGPGVISGVGTSTAALIGPALRGPINEARRITSFDDFLALYAAQLPDGPWPYISAPQNFYLAHAVRGFFENSGRQAYIVRAGTGRNARLTVNNQGGHAAFIVEAQQDGAAGNSIQVETEISANKPIVRASTTITAPAPVGAQITVADSSVFRVDDFVAVGAGVPQKINTIVGNLVTVAAALAGAVVGATIRIADLAPTQAKFRVANTAGLYPNGTVLLSGDDAGAPGTFVSERVALQSVDAARGFVTFKALPARVNTYNLDAAAAFPPMIAPIHVVSLGNSNVALVAVPDVTVGSAAGFRVGDVVTVNQTNRATITKIVGNVLTLDSVLPGLAPAQTLRIANFPPTQLRIRLNDVTGLSAGGVVRISGDDATAPGNPVSDLAFIQSVEPSGFVTLRAVPATTNTYNLGAGITDLTAPIMIAQEFRLTAIPPAASGRPNAVFSDLSLDPVYPRYILNQPVLDEIAGFDTQWIRVLPPPLPPTNPAGTGRMVTIFGLTPLAGGIDDAPSSVGPAEYQAALDVLKDVDDVNMVAIPDASSHPAGAIIQRAIMDHCIAPGLQDRFAILDSRPGAPPSGPGSIEEQRQLVEDSRGFAALYYPWLQARDPQSKGPIPTMMMIPPSGHMAGVYARTDIERGVHKAPANVDVRGVTGLERILSDNQQGPLNLLGINVLRIFPGTARVLVWGARTTVQKDTTDWIYVNVRRLMLYIEESIDEGIRWAVFEPNALPLWQKLRRTLNEFLTRVWREGALFGDKAEKAFYVRIDESLNPPSTRALGRLYIEIGVAPVRPAEFIIVRIGLFDGGAEISEL